MAEAPPIYQALTEVLQASRYARSSPAAAMAMAETAVNMRVPGNEVAAIHDFLYDHMQMAQAVQDRMAHTYLNQSEGQA